MADGNLMVDSAAYIYVYTQHVVAESDRMVDSAAYIYTRHPVADSDRMVDSAA